MAIIMSKMPTVTTIGNNKFKSFFVFSSISRLIIVTVIKFPAFVVISPPVPVSDTQTGEMESGGAVIMGSVGGAGAVLLILFVVLLCSFTRRMRRKNSDIVEDNPAYNDNYYYQEGTDYTRDRNTYYN